MTTPTTPQLRRVATVAPAALVICAGIGLSSIPLRECGFDVTGIEIDDRIAEVNRANGGNCITADFTTHDPRQFSGVELIQVSPPCQSFSQAKAGGKESPLDIAIARQICRYIRTLKPRFFMLENVWLYRKSASWAMIRHCLERTGYRLNFWRLCSADYGSAQTRHRMIVLARRDGIRPHKPFPTHAKTPDMFCQPWRGWLEAIEDLIPSLPDSEFAAWHKARMPAELLESLIVEGKPDYGQLRQRCPDEPMFTVQASAGSHGRMARAFILSPENGGHKPGGNRGIGVRNADSPVFTIKASAHKGGAIRAFIADFRYAARDATIRAESDPVWAVQSSGIQRQSWVKAAVCGRVVAMTPRCYARWQDLPDWFVLPASNELACRGIGNGVPLNLTRACLRSLGFEPVPFDQVAAPALWRLREEKAR